MQVVLYTRQDCPLCDEAHDLLVQAGLRPQLRDVDQQPELIKCFGNCVPVVEINGKIRFRGRIHAGLLRRLLRGEAGKTSFLT